MVQSAKQNARTASHLAQLEAEIRDAVANGVSLRELQELVSTIVTENERGDLPIYLSESDLPPGVIPVSEAARKYSKNRGTIHTWIRAGHLQIVAKLRGPARGGGFNLISEAELVALIADTPPMGRPKRIK